MKYIIIITIFFSTTLLAEEFGNSINPLSPTFGMSKKAIKAKRIYRSNLKKRCRFTGAVLAQMHTQDEWEEIKEIGNFKKEIYNLCPRSKYIIKDEWIELLYYFMYNYASDAGTFPKC